MYNETQKRRFLESLSPGNRPRAAFLFGISEEYEVLHDLDISCMTTEQLNEAICPKTESSTITMSQYARMILRYKSWCQSEGLSFDYPTDTLSISTSSLKASSYIFSPGQLQHILDQALAPVENKTADNFPRAACWLAFSGINVNLCDKITPETIDLKNAVVTLYGHQFRLYAESIPVFQSLCRDESFISFRSDGTTRTGKRSIPGLGESIFKGTRSTSSSPRSRLSNWRTLLKERTASTEFANMLGFDNLRTSGVCYLIHQEAITLSASERKDQLPKIIRSVATREVDLDIASGIETYTAKRITKSAPNYNRRTKYANEYKAWQQAFAEWLALDSISDQ